MEKGIMEFRFKVEFNVDEWDSGVPYELAGVIRDMINTGKWEHILRPESVYPLRPGAAVVTEFKHAPYLSEPDYFVDSISED